MTVAVVFSLPPKSLHPNARGHWKWVARDRHRYSDSCIARTLNALAGNRPRWKYAACQLRYYRTSKRRMDPDKLLSWAATAIDALQEAGLIENDKWLTHLPVEQVLGVPVQDERLEIEITPEREP